MPGKEDDRQPSPRVPRWDILHRFIQYRQKWAEERDKLNRSHIVEQVISALPQGDHTKLQAKLDSFFSSQAQRLALAAKSGAEPTAEEIALRLKIKQEILRELFQSSESQHLSAIEQVQTYPDVLHHGAIIDLMQSLCETDDDIDEYRFQIATLLSLVPFEDLPGALVNRIRPTLTSSEMTIEPKNGAWYLCSQSEPKMREAMKDRGVIIINDALLMKMYGKQTALCFKALRTKNGDIFLPGIMYSMMSHEVKEEIFKKFIAGDARISIDKGQWAVMREFNESGIDTDDFIDEVKAFAQGYGDNPRDEKSCRKRQRYVSSHGEEL